MNKRIEFPTIVKRTFLDNYFSFQCMFLDCGVKLERNGPISTTGDFCHIIAASEGGPRASTKYDKNFISSIDNCILMCKNCAWKIDHSKNELGEWVYSAEKLFSMREKYIAKINYSTETFSHNSVFDNLRKLISWLTTKPMELMNPEFNEIELPIPITKKIEINLLPKQYIDAVRRITFLYEDIKVLINDENDKMDKTIAAIISFYLNLKKENGEKDFTKVIKYIVQENEEYWLGAMYFTAYLFIRCDILKKD